MTLRPLIPFALGVALVACTNGSKDDDTDTDATGETDDTDGGDTDGGDTDDTDGGDTDDTDGGDTDDTDVVDVGGIRVNEVMASNETALERERDGAFPDWIELVNTSDAAIDLTGATISDDLTDAEKHTLPAGLVVPAGGYLILWADDGTIEADSLPFKLTADGESVGIWAPDGTLWDSVTFPAQTTDVSWARSPDGTGDFAADGTPTGGVAND